MTREKLTSLLQALKTGTEARRIAWQDLPDEEMFRAHVGTGMVRVGKTQDSSRRGYSLWVMSITGAIAAELDVFEGEGAIYSLIEDVYMGARLSARGGDSLLDSMIRELVPVK